MDLKWWPSSLIHLTHWGWDKITTIPQMPFLNIFSSKKIFEFWLRFHWGLFQSTIFHPWFRQWLGTVQATSHYLNKWWLVNRRIYVSLCLNELKSLTRYYPITCLCLSWVQSLIYLLYLSLKHFMQCHKQYCDIIRPTFITRSRWICGSHFQYYRWFTYYQTLFLMASSATVMLLLRHFMQPFM